ncbi:transmembrane protein 154 isoform X2 [Cheilinus undulatus]|uniref:transmembrane protein 154 isoform X2 n=1 Tax=Cheilinus undulatus TaxID=241271 RepID=UPI001BD1D3F4|nr:transmembrane protein 154 isoform X2 [Cheilinus undulatus]
MSPYRPCNMRGPRLKTPLLLLLLLTALTWTGLCQDYDTAEPDEATAEEEGAAEPDAEEADGDYTETSDPVPDPEPTDPGPTSTAVPLATEDIAGSTQEEDGSGETLDPSISDPTLTTDGEEEESLSPIIILIPVVLVVIIIGMIVCGIFLNRRWNNKARNQELKKEDPYLDGSSTEKVPMPMFEEDVPSVLELEMEELDQWMKKDGDTAEETKQE